MNCNPTATITLRYLLLPLVLLLIGVVFVKQNNFVVSYAQFQTEEEKRTYHNDKNDNGKNNTYSRNEFIQGNDNSLLLVFTTLIGDFENAYTSLFQQLYSFLNTFGIDTVKAAITLFIVIDPIGINPLFASLTEKMQKNERKSVSQTATITSGILLLVFAIAILRYSTFLE